MTRIEGKTMFLRILKKDLKRKKTMNVILLIFVILCSTFAAASVNNIIAVTGGLDFILKRQAWQTTICSLMTAMVKER